MGGATSRFLPVPKEDFDEVTKSTRYTRAEIEYLYTRFRELCEPSGRKRYIVKADFGYPTYILQTLILAEMFGSKYRIDFIEFANFLHIFNALDSKVSTKERDALKAKKLRLLFSMYDTNKDGDINKHDLLNIVHRLFSKTASIKTMVQIVNSVMEEMAQVNPDRILFQEFCAAMEPFDMEMLVIKFPVL